MSLLRVCRGSGLRVSPGIWGRHTASAETPGWFCLQIRRGIIASCCAAAKVLCGVCRGFVRSCPATGILGMVRQDGTPRIPHRVNACGGVPRCQGVHGMSGRMRRHGDSGMLAISRRNGRMLPDGNRRCGRTFGRVPAVAPCPVDARQIPACPPDRPENWYPNSMLFQ